MSEVLVMNYAEIEGLAKNLELILLVIQDAKTSSGELATATGNDLLKTAVDDHAEQWREVLVRVEGSLVGLQEKVDTVIKAIKDKECQMAATIEQYTNFDAERVGPLIR